MLITSDSLRADHLCCLGYKRNTSPNIDRLAQEGVLFRQAISTAPYTTASIASILTSTYPLMYGGYTNIQDRTTIAEIFKENHYTTAAFHSNPWPLGPCVSPLFGSTRLEGLCLLYLGGIPGVKWPPSFQNPESGAHSCLPGIGDSNLTYTANLTIFVNSKIDFLSLGRI